MSFADAAPAEMESSTTPKETDTSFTDAQEDRDLPAMAEPQSTASPDVAVAVAAEAEVAEAVPAGVAATAGESVDEESCAAAPAADPPLVEAATDEPPLDTATTVLAASPEDIIVVVEPPATLAAPAPAVGAASSSSVTPPQGIAESAWPTAEVASSDPVASSMTHDGWPTAAADGWPTASAASTAVQTIADQGGISSTAAHAHGAAANASSANASSAAAASGTSPQRSGAAAIFGEALPEAIGGLEMGGGRTGPADAAAPSMATSAAGYPEAATAAAPIQSAPAALEQQKRTSVAAVVVPLMPTEDEPLFPSSSSSCPNATMWPQADVAPAQPASSLGAAKLAGPKRMVGPSAETATGLRALIAQLSAQLAEETKRRELEEEELEQRANDKRKLLEELEAHKSRRASADQAADEALKIVERTEKQHRDLAKAHHELRMEVEQQEVELQKLRDEAKARAGGGRDWARDGPEKDALVQTKLQIAEAHDTLAQLKQQWGQNREGLRRQLRQLKEENERLRSGRWTVNQGGSTSASTGQR
mmetsp:Transcript_90587/g.189450  ORF Transcript_90587/g.189450 Transcript_90587/m.189450 type:complete len:537 (+) Transcript_90587:191-1801(+)|eukprot:CAMPEP_0206449818 /NCGR_PEP_ID=MMETSP0324_2-20121206/18336_1 /ASSEMBLY_ACC=CAM_ASM_000836 /TAXON_ID=2866 /ORGANISM="Crypthecodinium cohnii, Strain Seligo" /LENGTH=536 /DNA_ID=CAMNT_0053919309 /DNA_START=124 /DNA_END=1734 /DNA_ORIENTATION=+